MVLNADQIEYTPMQYDDCLCAECLLEIRADFNKKWHVNKLNKIIGFG